MSKRNRNMHAAPPAPMTAAAPSTAPRAEAFTFGDPVPVMDRAEILDYVETWSAGNWFEPPVSWSGLAKTFRAGVHHGSAIYFKRNVLSATFIPHRLLTREVFDKWALDFLTFGNGYLELRKNRLGGPLALERAPAKYMRRATDLQRFYQVNGWRVSHEFAAGTVHHLMEPDINQEVYGLPEYLGALHAAWLNESATLFRRRYWSCPCH